MNEAMFSNVTESLGAPSTPPEGCTSQQAVENVEGWKLKPQALFKHRHTFSQANQRSQRSGGWTTECRPLLLNRQPPNQCCIHLDCPPKYE